MTYIDLMTKKVIANQQITKAEALLLYKQPLDELCHQANEIRKHFCKNTFDICTIINAKSGLCSENCRFCAQSAYNKTNVSVYPLLNTHSILEQARLNDQDGMLRFALVTSGRSLTDDEIDKVCHSIRTIKETTNLLVCASFGLLNKEQYSKLKNAGVSRVHNNLETSSKNFPNICTTHTFADKVNAIKAAQEAGLEVCSGGIMGLGESVEDRIDMALTLRELGINSVPINILNPIPCTPLENNDTLTPTDIQRIVATYRFILPNAFLRLSGGRSLLKDQGRSCFLSGANAAISGNMLTTTGTTIASDLELIKSLGYRVEVINE